MGSSFLRPQIIKFYIYKQGCNLTTASASLNNSCLLNSIYSTSACDVSLTRVKLVKFYKGSAARLGFSLSIPFRALYFFIYINILVYNEKLLSKIVGQPHVLLSDFNIQEVIVPQLELLEELYIIWIFNIFLKFQ